MLLPLPSFHLPYPLLSSYCFLFTLLALKELSFSYSLPPLVIPCKPRNLWPAAPLPSDFYLSKPWFMAISFPLGVYERENLQHSQEESQ